MRGDDLFIDAQTFEGIPSDSVNFVISAHVIEHLLDPIGAIASAIRIIKTGGIFLIAVPDMRFNFDQSRPETSIEHALRDALDGGEGTKIEAFKEVVHYVHKIEIKDVDAHAKHAMNTKMDIHVHAWTHDGFKALLTHCETILPMKIEAAILSNNENLFALRKL